MKNLLNRYFLIFFYLMIHFSIFYMACSKKSSPTERESRENNWLPITESVNGSLTEIEGIPLLTLWGTNYEQGYAHGYLYAPQVIEYAEIQFSQPGLVDLYENVVLSNIHNYTVPQEYLDELQGFLDGMEARAGGAVYLTAIDRDITLNDLIASTCIDNMAHLISTNCTSFSAWDFITEGGTPITGRNYDNPDDVIHTGRFIFIVRKAPPGSGLQAWISVNLPGSFSCETAMNIEGVTLATQEVNLIRETSATTGFCPEFLLQRRLLESARSASVVEDVSAVLQELYTNGGEANLISWPSGQAGCSAVFEVDGDLTTGHGFTVRQPETGYPYMIQTNQFYERLTPEASTRYSTIKDYLDGIIEGDNPALTVDQAWNLLAQVPAGDGQIIQIAVVFEPDEMLMHVAFGEPGTHATSCRRITLNIEELLN
jgi:hypothetical protein